MCLIFLMNTSGSMGNGYPNALRVRVAKHFVDRMLYLTGYINEIPYGERGKNVKVGKGGEKTKVGVGT